MSLPKTRAVPEMVFLGSKEKDMEYWSYVWRGWEKYEDVVGDPLGRPDVPVSLLVSAVMECRLYSDLDNSVS